MVESPAPAPYLSTMKTVLITGCSSGYGLETARYFHSRGWNVIATMRTPREDALPRSDRLRVVALDVTKPHSIAAALETSGPIDALVNNAGIGVVGAFEATPMATTREVFETNTFGFIAMTQAVLPAFRTRRAGVVVNVTSSVTLAPMPLAAVYTASKMAIEGFTASLALELEFFNVRVKLVEPGYGPAFRGDDGARRGRRGLACRKRCVRAAAISSGGRCDGAGPADLGAALWPAHGSDLPARSAAAEEAIATVGLEPGHIDALR